MLARPSLALPLVGLLAAPLGCSGDDAKDPASDPTGDTAATTLSEDDTGGGDSDTGSTSSVVAIDAQLLLTTAAFAYDEVNGMVVPYVDPNNGPQPITFAVILADSSMPYDPNGPTPSNSCSVVFTMDTPQPVSSFMAGFDALWWGIEIPASADVSSDCQYVELPEEFGGDAVSHVAKWSWGVGIGAIDPSIAQQIEAQLSPSDWAVYEPLLIGSGSWSDAFEGLVNDEGLLLGSGQAFEADTNFSFVVDRTGYAVTIPAADVWDGKTPARGIYVPASQAIGPASILTR